jgi:predicted acylesterase/phospholipase RssA
MGLRDKKKIGLVLSGGGIKAAAFHIGVCLALREKGFRFAGGPKDLVRHQFPDSDPLTIRLYAGSSAGSFISAILASGFGVDSLIESFNLGFTKSARFEVKSRLPIKPLSYRHIFSLNGRSLLNYLPSSWQISSTFAGGLEALLKSGLKLNGLFTTRGIEQYLRKYALVENEFSRLGVELYIVATQLNHTRKAIFGPYSSTSKNDSTMYIGDASISEAVACSVSLPPVFAPTKITRPDGKEIYFYDGEIRETLSAHIAADHGCDLVISSYSVQPYHYTEEVGSLHRFGIPVILNQALYQVIQQKITKHIEWDQKQKEIYSVVDQFFKDEQLPELARKKILAILEKKIYLRPDVDYIYIHPRAQNREMFFADHFSLNPKTLETVVKVGFKSALASLRSHGL